MLELMEGTGLKGVAACMAVKPEAQRRLGDVLAEAVKVRLLIVEDQAEGVRVAAPVTFHQDATVQQTAQIAIY